MSAVKLFDHQKKILEQMKNMKTPTMDFSSGRWGRGISAIQTIDRADRRLRGVAAKIIILDDVQELDVIIENKGVPDAK